MDNDGREAVDSRPGVSSSRKPIGSGLRPALERDNDRARVQELARSGRVDEAIAATERHVGQGSRDAEFLRMRALLEQHAGRRVGALAFAMRAEQLESHPDSLTILAQADVHSGETDRGIERLRAVLAMAPDAVGPQVLLVEALESAVRVPEAEAALEPLLAGGARNAPELLARLHALRASLMVHRKLHGEAIEHLDREVLTRLVPGPQLRSALYLRAKACDRAGRFDDAFESAARANEIGRVDFDPAQYAQAVDALMSHWTRASMRDFPTSGSPSELPVFIAGMPRSGTSLLDQVIDAHAEAAGVGEMAVVEHFARELEQVWDASLPAPDSFGPMRDRAFRNAAQAYVGHCAKEAPGALRVVNKALGNNRIVGLLARLFPRTRIIHAIRDPRDVAVSCFMGGFNGAYYPWTARIEWIAAAWEQSQRLMEHWKRETDLPILDVRYEDVVTDPGTQFPRFIEFLGLEWDEGCTRFHESKRTVRTLSYDQVNRPLYSSSVGRWERYERHLRGVVWPP
jgi:tetratricopeptide (TPR) repeat protein